MTSLEREIQIVSMLIEVNSHNAIKPPRELQQRLAELRNSKEGSPPLPGATEREPERSGPQIDRP